MRPQKQIPTLRQICDEIRSRELVHDLDAGQIDIHAAEREGDTLILRMTDHVATSTGDHHNRGRSPVKVRLECSQFSAERLHRHFNPTTKSNSHGQSSNPTGTSPDHNAQILQGAHEPRHYAFEG